MKATKRLINKVWTLEYEMTEDNKITIMKHSRDDEEGIRNEASLPRMDLIEDSNRIVTGVILQPNEPCLSWAKKEQGTTYEVSNPKHIFSYDGE